MRVVLFFSCFLICLISVCVGKKGFGPGEQEWGYVTVRPRAHMFWWLYYTTAKVDSYYKKPLVIWLQGGPGASSTSFGNFEELGPIDTQLKERNYTWVKDYNVLFIDNPVGAGFSYVESRSGFSTTNAQIAQDLVECMRGFFRKLPKFANVPTYIMSESYGGKMAAEFALIWYQAQTNGTMKSNLKGVGLGDSWISPVDSVLTWAPFLLYTGVVDTAGYKVINEVAVETKEAIRNGKWVKATSLWVEAENAVIRVADNVDFYNILTKLKSRRWRNMRAGGDLDILDNAIYKENTYKDLVDYHLSSFDRVDDLMNGPVRTALGVNVTHGAQSSAVFSTLWADFMKPVTNIVEELLNKTNIRVFVYSGQLDLIVDTPGTVDWVERLKWKNATAWLASERRALTVDRVIEGYVKSYNNFAMYWVNRAGHMVPSDNPAGMAEILKDITRM